LRPHLQARQAAHFAQQQGCSAVLADLAFEAVITGRLTACQLGVPLLVNIHDDPPSRLGVKGLPGWFLRWYDRQFARTLRAAQRVGVISDYMGEEYQQRYGVSTQTLYPGVEATTSPRPEVLPTQDEPLWVGSVGSINSPENWQTLLAAVQLLNAQNGRGRYRVLHIGQPPRSLPAGEGVEFTGWLPPEEFNRQLARLSVGFLNMPFEPDLAQGARLSFPLKLSSLLGAGCPLLAFGPESSSVVRLVRQYACGAVCTEPNAPALAAALESLTNDGAARQMALQGVERLRADLSRDKFLAAFETFITV
jgi:glycosyltransferase involved in cell wall biosynthesis